MQPVGRGHAAWQQKSLTKHLVRGEICVGVSGVECLAWLCSVLCQRFRVMTQTLDLHPAQSPFAPATEAGEVGYNSE
jgi:hypothetical protein